MEIHYQGKITKSDFLRSILLSNPQLMLQRIIFSLIILINIGALWFLWGGDSSIMSFDTLPYLLPSVLFFVGVFSFPWWFPYVQLRSFDQKGNIYRSEVRGAITDTAISIIGDGVEASFQWSAYDDYKLDKDLLLLYQGKNSFHVFKAAMFCSPDEWETFISLAKEKILANKNRS